MQIIFQCPRCQASTDCRPEPDDAPVQCSQCDWRRDAGAADFDDDLISRCRVCGCDDLWRQKDFPPALGLLFAGMGILFSSLAWAWHNPEWAIGILMGFALLDMVLYAAMGDMLVCYRCRARHRKTAMHDAHPAFNLELSERYVQVRKRQDSESASR
jgi:hypothetical protein